MTKATPLDQDYPDLIKEWHPDNPPISSSSRGSIKKVKWICVEGHVWEQSPNTRIRVSKGTIAACPFCSGLRAIPGETDLATRFPQIAEQWGPDNNLSPSEVTAFSNKKFQFECGYGHKWITTLSNRTSNNSGCPDCSRRGVSNIEIKILCSLSRYGEVNHQVWLESAWVDIYMPSHNIAVEYDGQWYHKDILDRDVKRTESLLAQGVKVARLREPGLPSLNIQHENYVEVVFPWKSSQGDVNSQIDELISADFFQL